MAEDKDRLKKLLDEATANHDDEAVKKEIEDKNKKSKRKWPWFVGGGAIIALGVGTVFLLPQFSNTQKVKEPKVTETANSSTTEEEAGLTKVPIKLEEWQKKSYLDQVNSDNKADKDALQAGLEKYAENDTEQSNAFNGSFVSEKAGYTSDPEKAELDGVINPKYSYLTSETVKNTYSVYINRLTNPMFGGWFGAQYASNKPKTFDPLAMMNDMFTEGWWNANIKPGADYSKLPIYADWAENSYGGLKFKETNSADPIWYGQVGQSTIDIIPNDDGTVKSINSIANVTYTALDSKGKLLTRKGVLKLTLVQNPNTDAPNRLLINSASLEIK